MHSDTPSKLQLVKYSPSVLSSLLTFLNLHFDEKGASVSTISANDLHNTPYVKIL